jgi:hypothetical protein
VNPDEPKRSIDDRLDAVVMSLELLQAESRASSRRMEALMILVDKHEKDWEDFRRSMRVESQIANVKQLNQLTLAMTELARVQLEHAKRMERLEGLPPL